MDLRSLLENWRFLNLGVGECLRLEPYGSVQYWQVVCFGRDGLVPENTVRNISGWNPLVHCSTSSIKPNHTLLHYAIGAIPNMVRVNVSGWIPTGHCRTGSI